MKVLSKFLVFVAIAASIGCGSDFKSKSGQFNSSGGDAGIEGSDASTNVGTDISQQIDVSTPQSTYSDAGSETSNKQPPCIPITIYRDADGDGYGLDSSAVQHCTDQPIGDGWVKIGGDCDDTPPDENSKSILWQEKWVGYGYFVHPNAKEMCDHYDQDCDGITDEDCPTQADCDKTDSILTFDPPPCKGNGPECLTIIYSCHPWGCLANEICEDTNGNGYCDTCKPKKSPSDSCPNNCSDNDPYTWGYCNQENLAICESSATWISLQCDAAETASCVPFAWITNPTDPDVINLNYELMSIWNKGSKIFFEPKKFCESLAQPNAVLRVNTLILNKKDKSITAIGGLFSFASDFFWWASKKNPKVGKLDAQTFFNAPDTLFFFDDFPVCVAAKKEVEANGGIYPPPK